jgi:hypothetical protein
MRPKLPPLLPFFIYTPGMLLFLSTYALLIVQATVLFTTPAPGAVIHFSMPLVITWAENGVPPLMAPMIEYELQLCAGGQDITTMQQLAVLQRNGKFESVNTLSATIDPTWGGSSLNNA